MSIVGIIMGSKSDWKTMISAMTVFLPRRSPLGATREIPRCHVVTFEVMLRLNNDFPSTRRCFKGYSLKYPARYPLAPPSVPPGSWVLYGELAKGMVG